MSQHNMPPVMKSPEIRGRDFLISKMGRAAFILEQGPNASHKSPEAVSERSPAVVQGVEEPHDLMDE